MFVILLAIFYGCVLPLCGQETYHYDDYMGRTDKIKMCDLALILLKDARLKVRQVTGIRDEHSVFISFDIGVVIGKIREKYKRMMEIYREAQDRYAGRLTLQGPGLRYFRPLVYIIAMEFVRMLEVDIDKLIDMLEKIPPKMLTPTPPKNYTNTTMLRTGPSLTMLLKEEEYKSHLRERYTMKKLGINKTGWAWDINSIT